MILCFGFRCCGIELTVEWGIECEFSGFPGEDVDGVGGTGVSRFEGVLI